MAGWPNFYYNFLHAVSSVVLYQVDSMSQMKEKWKNFSGLMLCKMANLRNYNRVIIGGPPPRAHLPTLSFGANKLDELEKKLLFVPYSYRFSTVFLLFEPIVRKFCNFSA